MFVSSLGGKTINVYVKVGWKGHHCFSDRWVGGPSVCVCEGGIRSTVFVSSLGGQTINVCLKGG